MQLTDNTILITGGASGIGLALTRALLDRGNRVIVCGRNRTRLEKLKKQIPGIFTYRCDLADEASLDRFVDAILVDHPGLNILINNAGVQHNYLFTVSASRTDAIREEVAVNLLAPVHLTDRLLPLLQRQNEAAIVNITSALAIAPKKNAAVYCATKSALQSFTRALRYQLEGTSVSVFEIIPSLVDTKMTRGRGRGKISPASLADESIRAIEADRQEIPIEKTRLLYRLHRLFPSTVSRILKNA